MATMTVELTEQDALLDALAFLTVENNRLAALTDEMETIGRLYPHGIFRTDNNGRLTYANAEWFRITGQPPPLGPHSDRWLEAVVPSDLPAILADWGAALQRGGYSFSREIGLRRRNAGVAVVWIAGRSLVAPESDGCVCAIVGALTDTMHYRELEREHALALAERPVAQAAERSLVVCKGEIQDALADTPSQDSRMVRSFNGNGQVDPARGLARDRA